MHSHPETSYLIEFAVDHDVDFVGVSFAMTGEDIMKAKRLIRNKGAPTWVIAKIEKKQAVDNIDEIVAESNGIMVARGDLGVEMDVEEIPELQKKIIEKSNACWQTSDHRNADA